jgi:hypothetical protein
VKKYRIELGYSMPAQIKEFIVSRESKHFIWFGKRRVAKRSSWDNYYDTFEEAKQSLAEAQTSRISTLKLQLRYAEENLKKIMALSDTNKKG